MIFQSLLARVWGMCLFAVFVGLAALANSSPPVVTAGEGDFVMVSAVGDVMMGSTFPVPVLPPNDGASSFDDVKGFLKGDVVFGNLEGPLVDGERPRKCRRNGILHSNCFEFSMPPRYAQHLANAGFTVMNMANNHTYDFGERGVTSTVEALTQAGIAVAGCGRIARSEVRGKSIAVLGFAFSPPSSSWGSLLDIEGARRLIGSVKTQNHMVIVSFHGGAEGMNALHVTGREETFIGEDRGNVRDFARGAVDAGADLVIGHGPHVVRAIEVYKNKLIAYSLGNFLTYGMFNVKGPNGLGMVLQVKMDGETGDFLSGRIVPVALQQRGLPVVDPGKGAINLIRSLTLEDLGDKAIGIGEEGELYPVR